MYGVLLGSWEGQVVSLICGGAFFFFWVGYQQIESHTAAKFRRGTKTLKHIKNSETSSPRLNSADESFESFPVGSRCQFFSRWPFWTRHLCKSLLRSYFLDDFFFQKRGVSLGTRLELEFTWFVRPPVAETFLGLTKKPSINFKQLLPFTNQEYSFLFIDNLKIHLSDWFIRIFEWVGMMKQNWGFLVLVPPFTKTCMSGSFVSPFGSPFSVMAHFHGLLSDGPDRGGGEWSAWRWDIPGPRALWLCTVRIQISILVSNLIVSR